MACATGVSVFCMRRVMMRTVQQQVAAVPSADPDRQPGASSNGGFMHLVTDALGRLSRSAGGTGDVTGSGAASGSDGSDRTTVARQTAAGGGAVEV